jgi:phosphatidylinositol glycan class W
VNTFAAQFVLLVVPLLLSVTTFALAPWTLNGFLLVPTALLLLLRFRERGTPLPSHGLPSPHPDKPDDASQLRLPGPVQPLHAVTTWRAHMMLMTVLCILAVDFRIFPRALAKCESAGVSVVRRFPVKVSHGPC